MLTNRPGLTRPRSSALGVRQAAMSAILALSCATAWSQEAPQGRWITASGNLEVEIAPCGKALCGTVTKVLGNRSMSRDGEEMKAVDARPAMGMKILQNFVSETFEDQRTTRWEGEIYNRENGKTYACLMSLNPDGSLQVRPYVGLSLFGKTQTWQRSQPAVQVGEAR
jgi:uncharacterized protein (DUF2147 family)